MAQGAGGAEAFARFKQYEYRANSSLVLTSDQRPRDSGGPTGEPETLWGRINPKVFGDRATYGKAKETEEEKVAKLAKKQDKRARDKAKGGEDEEGALDFMGGEGKKRKKSRGGAGSVAGRGIGRGAEESVLSLVDDGTYRPKTKETRAAYELLLSLIQQQFGDQPQDILRGAADEVLAVLKDQSLKDTERKDGIEKFLNPMANERYAEFVALGKRITDYGEDSGPATGGAGDGAGEGLDDDIGVAVEFEEEEEEEEKDFDEVQEEEEEEDEDGTDAGGMGVTAAGLDDDEGDDAQGLGVNVQDLDAYWLQRKIAQAYGSIDPQQSQKLASEALGILEDFERWDEREAENRLVMLLDYDKFDLIKVSKGLTVLYSTVQGPCVTVCSLVLLLDHHKFDLIEAYEGDRRP